MIYILFAFNEYEAGGGMNDMIASGASVEELLSKVKIGNPYPGAKPHFDVGKTYLHRDGRSVVWYDTIQIVNTTTLMTVAYGCNGEVTLRKEQEVASEEGKNG